METLEFGKNEKTKILTLDQLKQTASLAEVSGKLPANKPVEHFQLIESISELLAKKNYDFNLDNIYVAEKESNTIPMLDKEKKKLLRSYIFRRMVTKINPTIGGFNFKGHKPTIAIGYTEAGIQVSFGINVNICANMCIFGGKIMMTYGNQRMPFDKMMELTEKYIMTLPEISENDVAVLKAMRDIQIDRKEILENIGTLQINAVKSAYFKGDFPLNISQVSQFSSGIIREIPDFMEEENNKKMDLYDFYNTGTRILHPEKSDISTIWPAVSDWGDFISNQYKIEVPTVKLN